jgi:hypothetical protein
VDAFLVLKVGAWFVAEERASNELQRASERDGVASRWVFRAQI